MNVPSPLYCGAQAVIWSAAAETTRALIRACIGGGLRMLTAASRVLLAVELAVVALATLVS